MSLTISTDVFCDRCGWWDHDATVTGPRTNGRLARRIAKRRGWHIARGLELCPECVKVTEWPEDMRPVTCVNHPDQISRTNLDGDELCQACADAWVRGEGMAAAEYDRLAELEKAPHE